MKRRKRPRRAIYDTPIRIVGSTEVLRLESSGDDTRGDRDEAAYWLSGKERDFLCRLLIEECRRKNGAGCKRGPESKDILHRLFWLFD